VMRESAQAALSYVRSNATHFRDAIRLEDTGDIQLQ